MLTSWSETYPYRRQKLLSSRPAEVADPGDAEDGEDALSVPDYFIEWDVLKHPSGHMLVSVI